MEAAGLVSMLHADLKGDPKLAIQAHGPLGRILRPAELGSRRNLRGAGPSAAPLSNVSEFGLRGLYKFLIPNFVKRRIIQ